VDLKTCPPIGLAHFSVIEVPPLEMVSLAASIGYASIGLRLHPAFPGAPYYELAAGTEVSREMRRRLEDEGIEVYDIEFVTVGPEFSASSLSSVLDAGCALGAKRLSVCIDDPDHSRAVASFASLCDRAAEFAMTVDLEWMPWRAVANCDDALILLESADKSNSGLLVDALHLARTGGKPSDLRDARPGLICSAQLCDAVATRPASIDGLVREARSGRLPPGHGTLPLRELLGELPPGTNVSVEVPKSGSDSAHQHALQNFRAARDLFSP
jgi:sugar phosphate isomerase/epimerase